MEGAAARSQMPLGVTILLTILCAIGSAIFSGLTLGLMTLDCVQLKMIIDQKDKTKKEETQAKYAARILPLRRDGNYLLVTLLVGNVAVNSGFTLLLGRLVSDLVAFLISAFVITIFGEIVPQAVCSRHGLLIGGWLGPFVLVIKYLMFPAVKPLAILLNFVLGEEIGSIYTKKQLKALVEHHEAEAHVLSRDEARILYGGLDFALKHVDQAMTPIQNVFGLDIESRLDYNSAADMLRAGYSRVPIMDYSKKQTIVGLVFVRDLVLMDPEVEVSVRSAHAMLGRKVYVVDSDTTLLSLLTDFKKGRLLLLLRLLRLLLRFNKGSWGISTTIQQACSSSNNKEQLLLLVLDAGHTHLAVVRRVVTDTDLDPYYEHIGIITLEDIIEEILQDEIYDEAEAQYAINSDCPMLSQALAATSPKNLKPTPVYPAMVRHMALHTGVDEDNQKRPLKNIWNKAQRGEKQTITLPVPSEEGGAGGAKARNEPRFRRLFLPGWLNPAKKNSDKEHISDVENGQGSRVPDDEKMITMLEEESSASKGKGKRPTAIWSSHDREDIQHNTKINQEGLAVYANQMLGRIQLCDRRRMHQQLDANECMVIRLFLSATVKALAIMKQPALQHLLSSLRVQLTQKGTVIYTKGSPSTHATLILQGKVKIEAGAEEFLSNIGPWSTLAMKCLGFPSSSELELIKHRRSICGMAERGSRGNEDVGRVLEDLEQIVKLEYVPDYTATVAEDNTRLLRVSQDDYFTALKASLLNMQSESETGGFHNQGSDGENRGSDVGAHMTPKQSAHKEHEPVVNDKGSEHLNVRESTKGNE